MGWRCLEQGRWKAWRGTGERINLMYHQIYILTHVVAQSVLLNLRSEAATYLGYFPCLPPSHNLFCDSRHLPLPPSLFHLHLPFYPTAKAEEQQLRWVPEDVVHSR